MLVRDAPERAGVFPHLKPLRNLIFLLLATELVLPVKSLLGQAPAAPTPTAIKIVVVEGEGFVHNVQQRSGRDPVVRIEDQNQKPLTEAAVVFTLPTEGSSGEFGNGSKTLTIVTGRDGIAKAQGLKVYRVNGKLPIHVTASYRGLTTRTIIGQTIEGAPPGATGKRGGHGKVIAILAIVGAGAAGGGYYAYTAAKTTPTAPSVSPTATGPAAIGITPGGGTIAPPH